MTIAHVAGAGCRRAGLAARGARGCAVVVFLLTILLVPRAALAGHRHIAQLPVTNTGVGIAGIAFDGGPNPLVLDADAWTVHRIDVELGGILASNTPLNPPGPTGWARSFTHDQTDGAFYAQHHPEGLVRISPDHTQVAHIGPAWPLFNFMSLAVHPLDGSLWLATDNSGGQLWRVNKQTGAVTHHRTFGVFHSSGGGIQALSIGPDGQFYVVGGTSVFQRDNIYAVDPDTGVISFVTALDLPSNDDNIEGFDYSPVTGRWYGVHEVRLASPRRYNFIEITGIPEPTMLAPIAAMALALAQRRGAPASRRVQNHRIPSEPVGKD